MDEQVTINVFADPMMGMHWELYPSLRKLKSRLGKQIKLNFIPIELVKNVYNLTDKRVLAKYGKTVALDQYWAKLMEIYLQEEQISGMPILMGSNDLHLFDQKHISSKNLDLAYLAVAQLKPEVSNDFLYHMQFATVIEDKQTTDIEVLADLAAEFGINKTDFKNLISDHKLSDQLTQMQVLANKLKIEQLPAFSIEYQGKFYVVKGIVDYDNWLEILNQITDSKIVEHELSLDINSLEKVLMKYSMISEVELKAIFDLNDQTAFNKLIDYLVKENKIKVEIHKAVKFFKKVGK